MVCVENGGMVGKVHARGPGPKDNGDPSLCSGYLILQARPIPPHSPQEPGGCSAWLSRAPWPWVSIWVSPMGSSSNSPERRHKGNLRSPSPCPSAPTLTGSLWAGHVLCPRPLLLPSGPLHMVSLWVRLTAPSTYFLRCTGEWLFAITNPDMLHCALLLFF